MRCSNCKFQWCYICGFGYNSALHFCGDGCCNIVGRLIQEYKTIASRYGIQNPLFQKLLLLVLILTTPVLGVLASVSFFLYMFGYFYPRQILVERKGFGFIEARLDLENPQSL